MATEFANLTGMDGTGTGNNGSGTSVSAGSLTPSASGDLVYQVVASLAASRSQSSFAAGSQSNIGWNLLSADLMDGWAGQYGVYNSTSPLNPSMTMGSSQPWASAAVLLKTGSSGSVPSGMRIVHLVLENIPQQVAAGGTGKPFPNPLSLQFPSSGNLLLAMIAGGHNAETVTSISDSSGNSWSQAGATAANGDATAQAYYTGGAATSADLGLTLNWSGSSGDYTALLYDVTGAAAEPLDTATGAVGTQATAGNLTMPFTITPATANELVFLAAAWQQNTGTGLVGQFFDANGFSGESLNGPGPVDENNGWGHAITTSTAAVGFTFTLESATTATGNWVATAAAFQAAH